MTVKRKDLAGAKKRGLVSKREVESVKPTRHRRHCPACGDSFLPQTANHRGFDCACCAFEWGELRDRGQLDRRIGTGVEVVLLQDGLVGVVQRVPTTDQAEVRMEDGRALTVGPKDVERIQYLQVTHRADCRRNRSIALKTRLEKGAQEGRQDAEDVSGDSAREADAGNGPAE